MAAAEPGWKLAIQRLSQQQAGAPAGSARSFNAASKADSDVLPPPPDDSAQPPLENADARWSMMASNLHYEQPVLRVPAAEPRVLTPTGNVDAWMRGRADAWTHGRVDMWTCGTCGHVDVWKCGRVGV